MDSVDVAGRRREAQNRLRAQRQRAGRLRNRVIAISLVTFGLLWGVVLVQMATGNDPVLGSRPALPPSRRGDAGPGGTRSEQAESEVVEPEPAEPEFIEPEPFLVPVPVETSQS